MKAKYLLLALALMLGSCSKNSSTTPTPTPTEGTKLDFVQRTWDNQKRGNIFYEIFVRSFADANGDGKGDLKGITDKLDYLQSIGISGIWMTPINPSPSYHGYDVTDYKSVNPDFGTLTDFDALVTKAHSLNIKVIIDLVLNHTSKNHPWFQDAISSPTSTHRSWYLFAPTSSIASEIAAGRIPTITTYNASDWHDLGNGYSYYGAFSGDMPDLNLTNPDVVAAIYDIAKFWLDRGTDGFRLDAVKHAWQNANDPGNYAFWKAFYNQMKVYKSDVYLVGEVLDDTPVVAPYFQSLPALFNFKAYWKLTEFLNNTTYAKWYPKDFNDTETAFAVYNPNFIDATKLSNHDEDRLMSVLNNNTAAAKVALAVLTTMPGQPYLYYGEEIGMRGLKATGDENVREPFLWSSGADSYRTTWHTPTFSTNATVTPLADQMNNSTSIFAIYKQFLQLRNTYPALANGTLSYDDINSQTFSDLVYYTRQSSTEKLLIMHNFGGVERTKTITGVKNPIAQQGGAYVTLKDGVYTATMPAYSSIIVEVN